MSPRVRRLALIALLVLVGEAIFGIGIYYVASRPEPVSVVPDGPDGPDGPAPPVVLAAPQVGAVYDKLPAVVANPAGAEGMRFLVMELDLLLQSELVIPDIEARKSRITDAVLGLLTHKRLEDIDESSEEDLLKRQLVTLINRQLPNGGVVDVIIKKLIIQ